MSTTLKDPRLYVKAWLKTNSVTINERGEVQDASNRNNLQMFTSMYLDHTCQVKAHNDLEKQKAANLRDMVGVQTDKNLQRAFTELVDLKKLEYRKLLIAKFKCSEENLEPLKAYIKAVTGSECMTEVNVIAHWMWQTKKKMINQDPSYHLMPIFFGKQEGGKTQALTNLIRPLGSFRLNIDLNQMTDDRYFRAMSENYVIVFDEMSGAQRTDMNALKKQITTDYNDYRPMGTNDVYKVRQSCSFIAASNVPVSELLVDTTGMRRFYQINCLDKLDWATINSVDYEAMWVGIDESRVAGYIQDSIIEIREEQKKLVAKEEIDLFMESHGMSASTGLSDVTFDGSSVYQVYASWAKDNGFKVLNNVWFGRKFCNKGAKAVHATVNGKTVTSYQYQSTAVVSPVVVYSAPFVSASLGGFNGQF